MDTRQAKDFLAQQTAEQAALDNVPFSDLERRMMYFTESDPASCANPLELNDEFEKQYETDEYEAKRVAQTAAVAVCGSFHHSQKEPRTSKPEDRATSLKHEDPEALRNWNEAIRTLRKGDHYILVLL